MKKTGKLTVISPFLLKERLKIPH